MELNLSKFVYHHIMDRYKYILCIRKLYKTRMYSSQFYSLKK